MDIIVSGMEPEAIIDLVNVLAVRGTDNNHYYLQNEHHVRKKTKVNSSSIMDSSSMKHCYSFEIHFVVKRNFVFTVEKATFCSFDAVIVTKWLETLNQRLESE